MKADITDPISNLMDPKITVINVSVLGNLSDAFPGNTTGVITRTLTQELIDKLLAVNIKRQIKNTAIVNGKNITRDIKPIHQMFISEASIEKLNDLLKFRTTPVKIKVY